MHACSAAAPTNVDMAAMVMRGYVKGHGKNHQWLSATDKVHSCVRHGLEGQRAAHQSGTTHCPQGAQNVICSCQICGGRQWRSMITVAKYMRQQLLRERMESPAPPEGAVY